MFAKWVFLIIGKGQMYLFIRNVISNTVICKTVGQFLC